MASFKKELKDINLVLKIGVGLTEKIGMKRQEVVLHRMRIGLTSHPFSAVNKSLAFADTFRLCSSDGHNRL